MNTNGGLSKFAASGDIELTCGEAAMLACLLEASVPKLGNVHRGADFEDVTFYDFVASAVAIGRVFDSAESLSTGELIHQAIVATRNLVTTNTNLGMVLLMAPLAKCTSADVSSEIQNILNELTVHDRDKVYQAIRIAKPGGLGRVEKGDVNDESMSPDLGLIEAMELVAAHDTVAKQYVNRFHDVMSFVRPLIVSTVSNSLSLPDGLVYAHLQVLAKIPDSLIARKCGIDTAAQVSHRAQRIVQGFDPGTAEYYREIEELDFWLRSDGHRRNPGTSADLIAAGLFLAFRTGDIPAATCREVLERGRLSPT